MRRLAFAIAAFAALSMDGLSCMHPALAGQFSAQYYNSAPADEYFGRMKLSYLGIDNTLRDSAVRAGAYTIDSGIISKVHFADNALQAWAAKYPRDPELPHSFFLAFQVYARIYTQDAQEKAREYMHLIATRYAESPFGKLERTQMHNGFTKHYFAMSLSCPNGHRARIPCRVLVSRTYR